jgi:hypothetical protein
MPAATIWMKKSPEPGSVYKKPPRDNDCVLFAWVSKRETVTRQCTLLRQL